VPEPFGLVGVACPVVVLDRGLTFGDFGAHDLLDVGLGEPAPLCRPGTQASRGTRKMRTVGSGRGRRIAGRGATGRGAGNGAGVINRGQS